MPRLILLLLAMLLPGCEALSPRPASIDQRLAALPTAGAAVERPVTIRWNDHLVPWVEAETDRDLFFALGLVHGHLRGAQVALMRLAARGRLSEVAGPFATEIDHALRILDFGRAAPAIRAAWPEETRALMAAFVAGLNHATMNARRPPPEFALLGLSPEPFTEDDLLAIGRLAGTDVNWLGYFALLPARGTPGFARLWERTVQAGSSATEAALDRRLALVREILAGTSRAGSNTMAVAGRRSASGGALIASDPHLGLNLPNLWLAAGMRSPSFHAAGLMVPGLPILGVGRNPEIGWGGTNMRAASSDLFDVSALPPEAFRSETVRIRQRLWFTATRDVRTTPHGPVLTDASVIPRRPGDVLALRWVGHEPTDEITALLAAARARDGAQFRAAFGTFGVSAQNMLWAHRDGSIGQFHATTIPDRRAIPREDPVLDARDPAATAPWQRLLRTPDLPFVVNPREGYLASANNRPEALGGRAPPVLGFFFSDSDRVERLREMLAATPRATPADLAAMQADTRSPRAARLAAALAQRMDGIAEASPLLAALRGWDGDYTEDSRAAVAFEVLLARLVPLLQPEERQGETGNRRAPESQWNFLTSFLLRDLDALPPERRAAVLRQAAGVAATDFAALGTWGEMHRLRVSHWLVNLPVVGGAFAYGDFPVGGSRETPMKTSHGLVTGRHVAAFGSMARHVSDMADPDANWFVLWGGQDGWLGSAAFADQVPMWRERRSIRIPLRPETVARDFPRATRLEPRR
ncbi:penicillin acylase family protein [Roseomonas sp. PWR1]|uniref:Penicillin acylase family protein n=1 Tax=Roseomonas nitratireducens TaxID=2820810 RepID=A0ABS4ATN2_9PROT|nr:penicillin acylase family protein [Neoroseomonas nitratireducens]MBP0464609.1 penicillin acylase family protein [Neoroseomonas nitratireducens]